MEKEINLLGEYAVFNSHTRDRYRRLERRAQFIREQIFHGQGSSYALERYKSELSALEWALRVVMKYYKEHPGEDDKLKPCPDCQEGSPLCETCHGEGSVKIPPRIRKTKLDQVGEEAT